jgi:c-di-GMP-binding flagellar brake protein YcgR
MEGYGILVVRIVGSNRRKGVNTVYYSDPQRFRPVGLPPAPGPQSTYDMLLALRGRSVFLTLPEGQLQLIGTLEDVQPTGLTVGLTAPLPALPSGTPLWVEVVSGPGVVRFQTEAPAPVALPHVLLHLPIPRQVESVQRRQFSRVPVDIQVAFATGMLGGTPVSGFGQTLDLSAGGMAFLTTTPLTKGQPVFLTFKTPDDLQYRALSAIILRASPDARGRYRVAVRFDGLPQQTENNLVQTVFWLQVKGRR